MIARLPRVVSLSCECEEARFGNQGDDWPERLRPRLTSILLVVLGARNDVRAGKPAMEVDIPAARGAERFCRVGGRFAADRAGLCLASALDVLALVVFAHVLALGRLRPGRHSASRSG